MSAEPMTDTLPIRVTLVDKPAKCWIGLNGTLLVVKLTDWNGSETIEVPVEIASTRMSKRLRASRLIVALLLPLMVPALTFATLVLPYGSASQWSPQAAKGILIAGGLLWLLAFLALFARFCLRQPTLVMDVKQKPWLEFWLDKRNSRDIEQMLVDMDTRKTWVEKHIAHPLRVAMADSSIIPWKATLSAAALCCVPAIIMERAWLFLAALLPPGKLLVSWLLGKTDPAAIRTARRLMRRARWQEASNQLDEFLAVNPRQAYPALLLLDCQLALGEFAAAANTLGMLSRDDMAPELVQEIQHEIVLRQRFAKRRKPEHGAATR